MLPEITILTAIFGFIFMILMLVMDREQPIFGLLGMIFLFVTSAMVVQIDVPFAVENIADNTTGTAITGTFTTEAGATSSGLFLGLGLFCLAYSLIAGVQMAMETMKGGGSDDR